LIACHRYFDAGYVDVLIMNRDGTGESLLTDDEGTNAWPIFGYGDSKIIYSHSEGLSDSSVLSMNLDGTGIETVAYRVPAGQAYDWHE
jgi:hypothetical protein